VILHVVWVQDLPDQHFRIPQLELCRRIPRIMLDTYSGWMNRPGFIPCEDSLHRLQADILHSWKHRLLLDRLNRRMAAITASLRQNRFHWEEQLWWMMASNFGMRVNAAAFEAVARSIPISLLARHRHQRIQLEALLFGQANLLEADFRESYPLMLKKEFAFLKSKYGLKKLFEQVYFLRMRPASFPTIRLSQLASLCMESTRLFAWLLACEKLSELRKKLRLEAGEYWLCHYVFDRPSAGKAKILGSRMVDTLIINSVIPLLYTYGNRYADRSTLQKALRWMEQIGAEQNEILRRWKQAGISIRSATDSQALLELNNNHCRQKKCLTCDIGKFLLRPAGAGSETACVQASITDGQLYPISTSMSG
jgi:hypothetical protein